MKTKSCLRFFSLVELLAVTCIAVAIIALLFPALERAQGMARKTFCKGNLQQMVVTTNLYKADNRGALPYSSVLLVDFSFLSNYITNFDMAVCPDTDDNVASTVDLVGNTSYHYMGSRSDWEKNPLDGIEYGFDISNPDIAAQLSEREEKVVYDRSDLFHYGMFNVVHLDSGHVESLAAANYSNFWYYDDSGSLDTTNDRTRNRHRYRHRYGNTYTNGNGNGYGSTDGDAGSEYSDNGSSDTTTTTSSDDSSDSGHNNNGHGNNEDGVDCSNPGQGNGGPNGEEDASGTVDDEAGNGNNGNGNGN